MDLTIPIGNSILNLRAVVLARTKNGFILEKSPDGFFYFIGGRIKINENSEEAAKRELFEETNVEVKNLVFKTIVENFFKRDDKLVHDICFVYATEEELEINNLVKDRVECPVIDFINMDIRPKILKDYVLSNNSKSRLVCKDY